MGYGVPVEDGAPLPEGFGSGGDSVEKGTFFYFFGGKKYFFQKCPKITKKVF